VVKSPDTEEGKIAIKVRKKRAKNINFLSLFFGTAYSAVDQLLIEMEEAERLMEIKDGLYPGLGRWLSKIQSTLNRWGFIIDPAGQRYHFKRSGAKYSMREYRQAANALCQGTATWMLHTTGQRFHDRQLYQKFGAVIKAPIYDEVLTHVDYSTPEKLYRYLKELQGCMEVDYGSGYWVKPEHLVPQVPEFTICIPGDDGLSRWSMGEVELPRDFTLTDISELKL